jgi:hypothetical protein
MKKTIITLLTMAIVTIGAAAPAVAIETIEMRQAHDAYYQAQVEEAREALLSDLSTINGPYNDQSSEFTWEVERWRPIVEMYFPDDRVDWALRIIECESLGDPEAKNPSSSASGLFQHLASLWPERAAVAGFAGTDVFDPFANIGVAAWLLDNGGTGHWVCKARM